MPSTARQHFEEDIARARAIVAHADSLPRSNSGEQILRSDLLRSGWMFAVGALDAYYCDAYTDFVASTANSKSRQSSVVLPKWVLDIKIPIRAVLEDYSNPNWRWRMAAREMMKRESVIKLSAIENLFKHFITDRIRFFKEDLFDVWMCHPEAKTRIFGAIPTAYQAMSNVDKRIARKIARSQFEERFGMIFQRRNDCIHNCDRPKVSPQPLDRSGTVVKVIQDIEFLVRRSDEHLDVEFPKFLAGIGCSAATISQAGY